MKKVTAWKKWAGNEYVHNHIEDGWVEGNHPLPLDHQFSNQRLWSKGNWLYKHGYLVDGVMLSVRDVQVLGLDENF